jgi:hypothetical protein
LLTDQSTRLFPAADNPFSLKITSGRWEISPNGTQIALLAGQGTLIDGIWVVDLPIAE